MRKSKQFQGMPVISLEEGQQIGHIKGLVVNPSLKNIAALIIELKGWLGEQKFIPFNKVHRIGEDAVTIAKSNRVEKGAGLPEILRLFKERTKITGSRLVTENGTILGVVEEYYVDLQTGDIVGIEFSGGSVSNMFKGSNFLDINYIRTLGPAVVICNDASLQNIVKLDGGLQETLRNFRENTGQLLGATFNKTKELSRNLNQSIEKKRRERKLNNQQKNDQPAGDMSDPAGPPESPLNPQENTASDDQNTDIKQPPV